MTDKEEVLALLQELPENVSLEEIQYHFYVRQKIQKAQESVAANGTISQEEIERRMARWCEA